MCSVISTPQMVLSDRLMAGVYPSFKEALTQIWKTEGLIGFYAGWRPALAQKIPSYGLTWVVFQSLKRTYEKIFDKPPNGDISFFLGAVAATVSVVIMIPMDTVKTRLVIQLPNSPLAYTGVRNCFVRIVKEEGFFSLYRALPPRLISVVPMIAIQFGVYEGIKQEVIRRRHIARALKLQNIKLI